MLRSALLVLCTLSASPAAAALVVDVWNPELCSYTASSRFTLGKPVDAAAVTVWIDWRELPATTAYILRRGGKELQRGELTRGSCDSRQPNWCEGRLPRLSLVAGDYRIEVPAARICQNGTSRGEGFVRVDDGRPTAAGYLGCYRDTNDRDIGPETFHDGTMTTERCVAHCAGKGFPVAATQFASHCFCGTTYGRHGKATNCDMKCSGNAAQTCGGSWANSVYATSNAAAAPAAARGPVAGPALGCFRDTDDRDIGPETFNDGKMTTERCVAHCAGKGFKFAATQFASHCFCGNTYGRHGKATNCDMKCSGNAAQTCGGSWANQVYATGN